MAKQVPWTNEILKEFERLALLSEEECYIMESRCRGTSVTAQSIHLHKSEASVHRAIASLTTTSGNAYQVSIPALIRQTCCCESQITAVIDADTITSASIEVTKL